MCIAIVTTAHPDYPFILLNNRDEYLHRPTAPAQWWPSPCEHILGGFDLHRPVHGTWLGMTRQGRIACLTNFREEDPNAIIQGVNSRGAIVNAWLKAPPEDRESSEDFAARLVGHGTTKGVGGFSLLYGWLGDAVEHETGEKSSMPKGLAIVSNRTPNVQGLPWVANEKGKTHALSNSHYGDASWPKVVSAERLTAEAAIASAAAGESKEELMERLFAILSIDTMPRQKHGEEWDVYLGQLRNSILIPPIGDRGLEGKSADEIAAARGSQSVDATSGVYGTQKQTLILVDKEGKTTFIERSLFDEFGQPVEKGSGDRRFDFTIQGWSS
ncbi:uncharacterized protein K452DRAFT_305917 [Aplosporella prunicola CBS 121167]|uniref:DUF833-domain-containing protein n=1 Tax=Aplosporella prunicola CBS 121167 TaxID=1176127 RepID=A0A6A6BNX6_9PEZI|nr:uncharacterized protein K452DRAFT_305917 [Aplosporella prunicola CBS 121167]KAF2144965.1 hypothetical protein K452DRAFT_305917 [Aplosporella prunicola CBS 121167]